jgi:electron-transferring-flavoprotein dehydrogenase
MFAFKMNKRCLGKNLVKPLFVRQKFSFCEAQRDVIETDVLIVGGGPAGLATAIKLKQLAKQFNKEIDVSVVEKGSEIGAHILSGNTFQPDGLTELISNWKEKGAPVETEVTQDKVVILTKNSSFSIPQMFIPKNSKNHGNYVISLSQLCRWLGKEAEELGVNLFTGFAANEILYNNGHVEGIITNDFGISKTGKKKDNYQAGCIIKAKQTVLAEGCRGSLTERVIAKYNLRKNPQHYAIGIKEVWEVPEGHPHFTPGLVQHSVWWPLDVKTYGGSFMYHMKPNIIHAGMVVSLDYENPYLNPYEEFQKWKTHKAIRKYFEGAKCIGYGSRCINEGGYYSIPTLNFPGGVLVGDCAGFLNVSKIKGTHNALHSGIIAAQSIFDDIVLKDRNDYGYNLESYDKKMKVSKVMDEMYQSRNFQGAFRNGLFFGMFHAFVTSFFRGKEFWEFKPFKRDTDHTKKGKEGKPIEYPKHDGVLTFDLLENLARSGTNHDHDQPSHLKVKPEFAESPLKSYNEYAAVEERYCPAKVYEFIKDEKGQPKLQINAQNCLHCKCCSIKSIDEYIDWNVPQGGEGPKYTIM